MKNNSKLNQTQPFGACKPVTKANTNSALGFRDVNRTNGNSVTTYHSIIKKSLITSESGENLAANITKAEMLDIIKVEISKQFVELNLNKEAPPSPSPSDASSSTILNRLKYLE